MEEGSPVFRPLPAVHGPAVADRDEGLGGGVVLEAGSVGAAAFEGDHE